MRARLQRGLTAPSMNDGLIKIVGFRDGWQGMSLLLPHHHGTRLAQVCHLALSIPARLSILQAPRSTCMQGYTSLGEALIQVPKCHQDDPT